MSELIFEDNYNLPTGWSMSSIGDVVKNSQYGWTTSATNVGKIKLLRTTDITHRIIDWETVPFCKNVPKDLEKYLLHDGDIVISRAGSVGVSHLIKNPEKSVFASYLIRFKPFIDSTYISYFLQSPMFWNQIKEKSAGITLLNVNATKIKQMPIPIAPFAEQKRIVAKIEELFSKLDSATLLLNKIKLQLRQYRQSLLKAAVDGTFFGDEIRYLKKSIREVIEPIGQGWSPRCERHASLNEREWGVIKTTAIQPLKFDENQNKKLPDNLKPKNHLELKEGDILITRAGPRSRVGITCLVRKTRQRLLLCDKAYRIRCKKDLMDPEFLEIVLNAPNIVKEIDIFKTGISDSGVNITQDRFLDLSIPSPSLSDQKEIVKTLEGVFSQIDKYEEIIEYSLRQSTTERKNILNAAFTGKLVLQDPNDEPAEILLQKIKQEKEKMQENQKVIRGKSIKSGK